MRGRVWEWLEITDTGIAEACAAHGLVPYEKDWFLRAAWLCLRRGVVSSPRLGTSARARHGWRRARPRCEHQSCAGSRPGRGPGARAALEAALTLPIDWEAVLEMAEREFVSCATLPCAARRCPRFPGRWSPGFKDPYRQTSARGLLLLHRVGGISCPHSAPVASSRLPCPGPASTSSIAMSTWGPATTSICCASGTTSQRSWACSARWVTRSDRRVEHAGSDTPLRTEPHPQPARRRRHQTRAALATVRLTPTSPLRAGCARLRAGSRSAPHRRCSRQPKPSSFT